MAGHEEERDEKTDAVYKTKVVNFLGRSVPIILQNDNGPCPLIAICNVLLLRNNISLHKEIAEISLQNLLTLIAERLLDSNSNNENKDENYIQNQQQNISDAISLLPRLATGIDVNVRFRNIYDFEFTPECAIFDLLDIGLVHGWLCDPQDENTSKAVGSNSYNVLVEKVVALHSAKCDVADEQTVDFAAATTASLGVPSPGLCSRKSFEGLQFDFNDNNRRKGDEEEAARLLEALDLSKSEDKVLLTKCEASNGHVPSPVEPESFAGQPETQGAPTVSDAENGSQSELKVEAQGSEEPTLASNSPSSEGLKQTLSLRVWVPGEDDPNIDEFTKVLETVAEDDSWHTEIDQQVLKVQSTGSSPTSIQNSNSSDFECLEADDCKPADSSATASEKMESSIAAESLMETCHDLEQKEGEGDMNIEEPLYEGEVSFQPLYEGADFENREPLYEGEAILGDAEPGFSGSEDGSLKSTETEGFLIENFLNSHASQLTYYGLFCLQEGLKERELCVFFRNNHFSTMFKYEGDLFLLVTDQGYLNQPDLVWEKLTEVDGDSVFYTGNFALFKVEEQNNSWNEREAVAATADFISSQMNNATVQQDVGTANYNSDLQLAMALQQQEFEQQQQQQQQQPQQPQQPQQQPQRQQQQQQSPRRPSQSPRKGQSGSKPASSIGTGRLFTGPRGSSPSPKPDAKSKEKCRIM